jgi:putative aldouronate transport system permease protein
MLLAFKKLDVRKGIFGSPWCGLDNFKFLFSSSTAFTIIRNTICYNVVFIILGTIIAVALAILLNEVKSRGFSKLYQSVLLIPYLISWVLASYLAYAFLAQDVGLINSVLNFFGKPDIAWYSTKKYWPFILFFVNIWKNVGYMLIIYYSSIVSISADYYEAATIDGATKWQQIKSITLPLIKSTVVTMTILNLGRIANSDFGLFYQIPRNSGALYSVTQTIDVYVYNALMNNNDFSMSAAASVFQSVVGFAFIMVANAVVRRYSKQDALF